MTEILETPIGILSYPHLFKARPVVEGGEPRFSCNLIFDETAQRSPDFQALRKLTNAAAVEFFGATRMKDPNFTRKLRSPFRPVSDRAGVKGYDDVVNGIFIGPWSRQQPRVVGPDTIEITVPTDVFAGQRARAQVSAFAYDNAGNVGVSFGLQALQITRRKMPRLDGRSSKPFERSPEEDDEELGVYDPTNPGAHDNIPF